MPEYSTFSLARATAMDMDRRARRSAEISAATSFAGSPNLAWQVALPSGIAYVNPHTGEVLGLRLRGQTFLGFARRLHVSLASGNIGRSTIRWFNLATLLLLISGLGLWWRDGRIRLRGFDGTRRFWSDLHK